MMALPYATEYQLNQLAKKVNKLAQADGEISADIPTKMSQLENDTGFITNSALNGYVKDTTLSNYALKTELPTDYVSTSTLSTLATKEELEDELQFKPVVCNMPFRTLSDKVYTPEEIFGWFWVEDLPSLKQTIISHPIYLRFGISLSGNPMYYYIPCQYVALTDANTLEMITDGLDTKNDKFSRYKITIKLNGTIVDGNSNIKVELKENKLVPDLPEDADTKTYQLKAVNGVLTWVE